MPQIKQQIIAKETYAGAVSNKKHSWIIERYYLYLLAIISSHIYLSSIGSTTSINMINIFLQKMKRKFPKINWFQCKSLDVFKTHLGVNAENIYSCAIELQQFCKDFTLINEDTQMTKEEKIDSLTKEGIISLLEENEENLAQIQDNNFSNFLRFVNSSLFRV